MNLYLTHLVAIAAAPDWASGLRLYAVVFRRFRCGWQHVGTLAVVLTVVLFKFLRALWRRFVPVSHAVA